MAYVPIPDTEIAPESPVTSVLQHKLRDNPLAIAEGLPGAPRMQFSAIGAAAGDVLTSYPEDMIQVLWTVSTKNGPGVVCGGITGTIRIKFSMFKGDSTAIYGQLKFNGADIGPLFSRSAAGKESFQFDHTLTGPGLIELFTYITGASITDYAGELAIYTTGTIQFTRENLNSGV